MDCQTYAAFWEKGRRRSLSLAKWDLQAQLLTLHTYPEMRQHMYSMHHVHAGISRYEHAVMPQNLQIMLLLQQQGGLLQKRWLPAKVF
jgi:hypothetical protein